MSPHHPGAGEIPGMKSQWVADDRGPAGLIQAFERATQCLAIATAQGADGSLVGACCSAPAALRSTAAPPTLVWSLPHDAPGLSVFAHASHVALNFFTLQDSATDAVERRFSTAGNDKFSALAFEFGLGGAPLLERAVASFECESRPQAMSDPPSPRQFIGIVRRYRQACQPQKMRDDRVVPAPIDKSSPS